MNEVECEDEDVNPTETSSQTGSTVLRKEIPKQRRTPQIDQMDPMKQEGAAANVFKVEINFPHRVPPL